MTPAEVASLKFGDAIEVNGKPLVITSKPSIYSTYRSKYEIYGVNANGSQRFLSEASKISALTDSTALRNSIASQACREVYTRNGSDPEIFVVDGSGEVIPSWKFLPSKEEALATRSGFYSYWDGFQAEISFRHSRSCHEELTTDVWGGLLAILTKAKAYDSSAHFLATDVVKASRKELFAAEDRHVMFGCAPSENIYGFEKIDMGNPREQPLRFAGTHYHYSTEHPLPPWWPNGVIAMMDKIGGLVLTALGRDLENPLRRKFYGRPGEFRQPGAGHLEYRTPSAYLLRSPSLFIFGADICRIGFKAGMIADGRTFDIPDVKDIILNSDADAAQKLISNHRTLFMALLSRCFDESVVQQTMEILLNPRGLAAKLQPVEVEWGLNIESITSNYRWRNKVSQWV